MQKYYTKECLSDGKRFSSSRSDAKYCSGKCRVAALRKRRDEELGERLLEVHHVVELPDGVRREYVAQWDDTGDAEPIDGFAVPKALLATLDANRQDGEDDSQTLLRLGLTKLRELAGKADTTGGSGVESDTPVRKRLVRRVDRKLQLPGSPQPVDKPVRYESQKMAELAREALRDHDAEDWDVPVIGSSS